MDETILRIFTTHAAAYFGRVAGGGAAVGTPFLPQDDAPPPGADFTAVIGFTGRRRGVVCFVAPRALLQELLPALGEAGGCSEALCADLAGEIANTISGNARAELGAAFMISVPVTIVAPNATPAFPREAVRYVLPLVWRNHRAALWIALEPGEERA